MRKQDKQYIDEPSHNHFCREKATSITFLERVLVIQHAMCMRRVILLPVACPAVQYFPTLSHKRHDFRTKVTAHNTCVLIFSTTFVWNISHQKNSAIYNHKCT